MLSIAAETGAGTTFVLAVQVLRIFVPVDTTGNARSSASSTRTADPSGTDGGNRPGGAHYACKCGNLKEC